MQPAGWDRTQSGADALVCYADAADDEGKCVQAELDILRNQARRNARSLAQHLPSSVDLPAPEVLPIQMHDGTQSNTAATACLSDELQQSTSGASQTQLQEGQDQGQRQRQGQSQGQGQRQGHCQRRGQSSGGGSEAELAAVEHGLSALEQQITAAALRCASQLRQCYVICMRAIRTMLTRACLQPGLHAELTALLQGCVNSLAW